MRMLLLLLSVAAPGVAGISPIQLNAEAVEHYKHARYPEAEQGFRRALEAWGDVAAGFERDRAVTALNLGAVLRIQGRYAEAEPLLSDALRRFEAIAGGDSMDVARAASGLAALYQAWGKPALAEPLAVRGLRLFAANESAPEDRANTLLLLSAVYMDLNRASEAEPLLEGIAEAEESRPALRANNDLAAIAIRRGDLDRAERFVLRALDMAPRVLAGAHPLEAAASNNLAQIRRFQGRYVEAEQNYQRAIEIWEKSLGREHPDTARGMLNLAALHHQRGRERAAEELYRRAASIFERTYGPEHELALVARAELAEVLRAERRYSESRRVSQATLPALESCLGRDDPRVVRAVENYRKLLAESPR